MSFLLQNINKVFYEDKKMAIKGTLAIVPDNDLNTIFLEAQKKYDRMHADDPITRFWKSLTGEIGQEAVKNVIIKEYNGEIIPTDKSNLGKYGVDIDVKCKIKNKEYNIAVSSRRVANIDYVITRPLDFFGLIPYGQRNQYLSPTLGFAAFVFISYSKKTNQFVINNIKVDIPVSSDFIWCGCLQKNDLVNILNNPLYLKMRNSTIDIKNEKGEIVHQVPMYTDNYVIFVPSMKGLPYEEDR